MASVTARHIATDDVEGIQIDDPLPAVSLLLRLQTLRS
jgi:hypothetical protein